MLYVWARAAGRAGDTMSTINTIYSLQFHTNFFLYFFFAFCMVYVVAYFHVFLYHEGFSLSSPVYQYIYIYNRQNRLSNASCVHTNFGVLFIDKVPICCRKKTSMCYEEVTEINRKPIFVSIIIISNCIDC